MIGTLLKHVPTIQLTLSGIRRDKAEFEWRCECGYLISSPLDWAQHVAEFFKDAEAPAGPWHVEIVDPLDISLQWIIRYGHTDKTVPQTPYANWDHACFVRDALNRWEPK